MPHNDQILRKQPIRLYKSRARCFKASLKQKTTERTLAIEYKKDYKENMDLTMRIGLLMTLGVMMNNGLHRTIDGDISPLETGMYQGHTISSTFDHVVIWKPSVGLKLSPTFRVTNRHSEIALIIELDNISPPNSPRSVVPWCRQMTDIIAKSGPSGDFEAYRDRTTGDLSKLCAIYMIMEGIHMEAVAIWANMSMDLIDVSRTLSPEIAVGSKPVREYSDREKRDIISFAQGLVRKLTGAASAEDVFKLRRIVGILAMDTALQDRKHQKLIEVVAELIKTDHRQFQQSRRRADITDTRVNLNTRNARNFSQHNEAQRSYDRAYDRARQSINIRYRTRFDTYQNVMQQYISILKDRALGITFMSNQILTPYLWSTADCRKSLAQVRTYLRENYPGFRLSINQCSDLYGSNFGQLIRIGEKYYLTLNLPVATHDDHFLVYSVHTVSQPVTPQSRNEVLEIRNLPEYVGVNSQLGVYITITNEDLHFCTKAVIKTCNIAFLYRSLQDRSCFSELFAAQSSDRILTACDIIYRKTSRLMPKVLELTPGIFLLYDIPLMKYQQLKIICPDSTTEVALNNMEITIQLPCRCQATAIENIGSNETIVRNTPTFYIPESIERCQSTEIRIFAMKIPYNLLSEKLITRFVDLDYNSNFWPEVELQTAYKTKFELRTDSVQPLSYTSNNEEYNYAELLEKSESLANDQELEINPYMDFVVDNIIDKHGGIKIAKYIQWVIIGIIGIIVIVIFLFRGKLSTFKDKILGLGALPMVQSLDIPWGDDSEIRGPRALPLGYASESLDPLMIEELKSEIDNMQGMLQLQRVISLIAMILSIIIIIFLIYRVVMKFINGTLHCPLVKLMETHPENSRTRIYLGLSNLTSGVHLPIGTYYVPAQNLAVIHERKPIYQTLKTGCWTSTLEIDWNSLEFKLAYLDIKHSTLLLPKRIKIPVNKNIIVKKILRQPECMFRLLCEQQGMVTALNLPLPCRPKQTARVLPYTTMHNNEIYGKQMNSSGRYTDLPPMNELEMDVIMNNNEIDQNEAYEPVEVRNVSMTGLIDRRTMLTRPERPTARAADSRRWSGRERRQLTDAPAAYAIIDETNETIKQDVKIKHEKTKRQRKESASSLSSLDSPER